MTKKNGRIAILREEIEKVLPYSQAGRRTRIRYLGRQKNIAILTSNILKFKNVSDTPENLARFNPKREQLQEIISKDIGDILKIEQILHVFDEE